MILCPNCHAENRSGARFCKNCATPLPVSPATTRPLPLASNQNLTPPEPGASEARSFTTRKLDHTSRTGTKPLTLRQPFLKRPAGAIFGDQYLYQGLLSSAAHQHQYWVDQVSDIEEMQIRVCPNPACGAFFPPRSEAPELFCTDCGTTLERDGDYLLLTETAAPLSENLVRTAFKGLSHGSVRAPLAAFIERLGGETRYCLVSPYVQMVEDADSFHALKPSTILKMGQSLGRGLAYLHDNGVHFAGKLDASYVGMIGDRAVWANFNHCVHHQDGYVGDRLPDTLALARMVYYWLTGKEQYEPVADLPAIVQQAFERVFNSEAIKDSQAFAQLMDSTVAEMNASRPVRLQSGRLSDLGSVRSLNEDSLMSLELDRTEKSISRTIGIYVVADGMGGHTSGEVASGQIVETFAKQAMEDLMPKLVAGDAQDIDEWLKSAVESANRKVFNSRKSAGTDMGSTLVAAVMMGNRAHITHIGDSRAYLINTKEIRQLTVDHSLVERMIASRQITREEARHHPQRNVIYRTIGDKPDIQVEVAQFSFEEGDYLLICSDGLSGMVEDSSLREIVLAAESPQAACDELIRAANAEGGEDNISVIIIKVVSG